MLDFNILTLSYISVVLLVAGFIRGYSGFGASMVIITGLSLVLPVMVIVPVILLLEVIASSFLMPGVYKEIDWSSLTLLLVGVIIATPIGIYILAHTPDSYMRAAVSILVITMIPFLWKGFSFKKMPGKKTTFCTGAISGLINGATAIGGPPIVLFYFSSPKGINISRASLIGFFLFTDIIAFGIAGLNGLVTGKIFYMVCTFLVPLVIGLYIGSRSFIKTEPELFRKKVLLLLALMAIATLIRSAAI